MILLKSDAILCFMERVNLPQGQVLILENRTFNHKILSNFYRNSKFTFLVNFDFVLSTP